MKVLLINGSPHKDGCTFTALSEVAKTLEKRDIKTKNFWIGNNPIKDCIGCGACVTKGTCVFADANYKELVEECKSANGIVVGSPVYYGGPTGAICSLLDRIFYSAGKYLTGKPGAAIVSCRRGGASAAFDRLNKYFTINKMPVVASQYWNSVHGNKPEETVQDLEGMQTMRTLGENMAYLLKSMDKAGLKKPEYEVPTKTNLIR